MADSIAETFVRIRPNMATFETETLAGVKKTFRRAAEVAGIAYGAATAFDLGKEAVKDAAAVQKSQEVVRAQFGQSSEAINKFAENAGIKLGIAGHETESVAARFGILFHNMGIGQDQAAKMTLNLEKLAGSLSAIRGIDPAAVLERLPIALAGNVRGLKQLGISIDANAIKTEALALGYGHVTDQSGKQTIAANTLAIAHANLAAAEQKYGEGTTQVATAQNAVIKAQEKMNVGVKETLAALTPAQRAQVIYAIATKNLGEYQQQAAAHAGDFANVQRRLSAEWDKAKETLGTALLPILSKYSDELAKWLDQMDKSGQIQRDVNQIVTVSVGIFQGVATVVGIAWRAFQQFSSVVGGSKHAVELLVGALAAIKAASWLSALASTASKIGAVGKAATVTTGEISAMTATQTITTWEATTGGAMVAVQREIEATKAEVAGLDTALVGLSALNPVITVTLAVAGAVGLEKLMGWSAKSLPGGPGRDTSINPNDPSTWSPAERAAYAASVGPQTADWYSKHPSAASAVIAKGLAKENAPTTRGPGSAHSGSGFGTILQPTGIYQLLKAQGASDAEANYLTAISGREDASGNASAINDSLKTHDYSVGLFQINFRDMQNKWMRGGKAAAARLAGDPAAQARYALSLLHSQGPTAWSTNTPALEALLGGSTGGTGGSTSVPDLAVGAAAKTATAYTKAQLAAAKQSLENAYGSIRTQAAKLGTDVTARIKSDMAKARTEIADVSDRSTVATARQKLLELRTEVTARLAEIRAKIALTNTFDGLKTQVKRLGSDVTPQIRAQMATIRDEIGKVSTPQQIANVRLQMTKVKNEIAAQLQVIKDRVAEDKNVFDAAWQRLASGADAAFQKATTKAVNAMRVAVTGAFQSFDFGGSITQTPAEVALQQLQDAHDAQAAAAQLAADQAQLAVDQGASGDPTQVVADQAAVADDLYQAKVRSLQAQATVERAAATQQLQDAQNAYQDQRSLLQQQMDDRVQAIETGMLNGTIAAADGMAQLTAVLGDPQYGIDMQNTGLVLGGQLYKGLSDGLKPVFDLLDKLLAEMTKAGLLKPPPAAASGAGGIGFFDLNPVVGQTPTTAPDVIARILGTQTVTQSKILDELRKQTPLLDNPVPGGDSGNAAARAAAR